MATTQRPEQRVSVSKKMDKDWYMNNIHYWTDIAYSTNDKEETLSNIDASNGVVSSDTYKYVLNPLSANMDKTAELPGSIRDTDFITPIREKNIGEYIELPHNFTVRVDDPYISLLRNSEVATEIKPILEQALVNELNLQQDTGVPTKDLGNIEKVIEETTNSWFDERGENAGKLVRWLNSNNNLESVRLTLFNDWWSTEECYIHVYDINGDVYFEEISPLNGFPVSNGNEDVQDHEAFVITRKLSIDRIYDYHREDLSTKDIEYLEGLIKRFDSGSYDVPVQIVKDYQGTKAFDDNRHVDGGRLSSDGNLFTFDNDRKVLEYTLYFKTEVKRKILYYTNQLGEVATRVLDEDDKDFVFNEEEGHLEVATEWISETWKQVLLGQKWAGIYIKPKPISVQVYDSRGHNKLPIVGKKGLLNGIYINPIPRRIIPNLALYRVLTLQIERQIAKYKGTIEIIPQSMLAGSTDDETKGNMFYKLADSTIIYDDTQVDFNTVSQGYRLVGDDSSTNYIRTLIDFRETIKQEAWDMSNMNDSRYGNAMASATVGNNQENIFRAKLGSMLMITTFNNILLNLYKTLIEFSKAVYPDGVGGAYFNHSDGQVVHFNIDSGELTENNYGVFMSNSIIDYNKLKQYKELAFSAAQNGEFEIALEAIDADDTSEVKKVIKDYIKANKEYEQQLEQQKLESANQINESQLANDKANRDSELEQIRLKEQMTTDREMSLRRIDNNNVNK